MALSHYAFSPPLARHSLAPVSGSSPALHQSASPPPGVRSLRAPTLSLSAHTASHAIHVNPGLTSPAVARESVCPSTLCSNHGEKPIFAFLVPRVSAANKRRGCRPLVVTAASAGNSEPSRDVPSSSAVRPMDASHVAADVVRAAEAAVLAWWATAATLPLFAVLLLTHATDLAGYLRSGNVPEDARKLLGKVQEEVEENRRSALSVVQERRAALVVYVNSGRMAEDVQSKAERWAVARWEELCDWTIVRAEDASDWLRATQRRLGKVVEKVF
ncbi:unnamed protein product [Closterium sp. Naga37s-1]|nr:unnamed protein product [Closterium sp. Naga37s-1]